MTNETAREGCVSPKRKALRIDRIYQGLPRRGRFAKATSPDARTHAAMVAMCDDLFACGRLDVLGALQASKRGQGLTMTVCLALYRKAGARAMRLGAPEDDLDAGPLGDEDDDLPF